MSDTHECTVCPCGGLTTHCPCLHSDAVADKAPSAGVLSDEEREKIANACLLWMDSLYLPEMVGGLTPLVQGIVASHVTAALTEVERETQARLADAWSRGAHAGADFQKRLTEWATSRTFIGTHPEPVPNPYRNGAPR